MTQPPRDLVSSLKIYRHRESHTFEVQPLVRTTPGGAGWGVMDGTVTVVGEQDFDTQIEPAVLEGLARSSSTTYDRTKSPSYSGEEYEKFIRLRDAIGVYAFSDGSIEILVFERRRGAYVATNDISRLAASDVPSKLSRAIKEAFLRNA